MIVEAKNNKQILLTKLTPDDFDGLSDYLQQLSAETKKRFGPHLFDKQSIIELYRSSDKYVGHIALDAETKKIIAYSIIKVGYLDHDRLRLESYGITLDENSDCTFAPSVADGWQSMGIGNKLFRFIFTDLKTKGIKKIILWGGVQTDNERAINYYLKNGFRILGQFHYNGENYDMVLEIRQ